jgi:long-chain fatty acid transport protein
MKPTTLALLLAMLPSSVLALGFRIVDHGAEATAKGGAFAATADNPSAIYHNPAGITQLSGMQVLMNGYAITLESTFDPATPGAKDLDGKYAWQAVPDAFITWTPKNSRVSLGLGMYAPFGLGVEYPDDAVFRSVATKGRLQFFTTNPVMAFQLTRDLSIAVGATLNYSRAKLAQGLVTPVGEAPGSEFILEGDGFAVGVNAGILWKPSEQWAFGLSYFGPMDMRYSGHARTRIPGFTGSLEVAPGVVVPVPVGRVENEEDFDVELSLPQTIAGGVSFRPTPDWNFEVNVEWTDWDSLNSPIVHLSENLDSALVFNYESSFMYEFGVTKKFAGGWTASAGYIYSENSVKNEFFNPLVADSNRHVLSAGLGRRYDHWNWYLAYQYSYGPHREIARQTVADGTYRFQAHALSFTLGYSF